MLPVSQSVGRSVRRRSESVSRLDGQSVGRRSAGWSIGRSAGRLADWSISWLVISIFIYIYIYILSKSINIYIYINWYICCNKFVPGGTWSPWWQRMESLASANESGQPLWDAPCRARTAAARCACWKILDLLPPGDLVMPTCGYHLYTSTCASNCSYHHRCRVRGIDVYIRMMHILGMYMYICIYVYMHVHAYIHIYIYIYPYTYVYIYIYIYIYIRVYVYMHVYTIIFTYICIYIYIHILVCVYVYSSLSLCLLSLTLCIS